MFHQFLATNSNKHTEKVAQQCVYNWHLKSPNSRLISVSYCIFFVFVFVQLYSTLRRWQILCRSLLVAESAARRALLLLLACKGGGWIQVQIQRHVIIQKQVQIQMNVIVQIQIQLQICSKELSPL